MSRGDIVHGGYCPGDIVRGILSGGMLSGGILSGGIVRGDIVLIPVLMTYKAKVSKTPDYLHKLLSDRTTSSSMSLRSSSRTLLCPKLTRTNYGDRAFSASAPRIWNELPANFNFSDNLNIFEKRLKTFLFNCAYN